MKLAIQWQGTSTPSLPDKQEGANKSELRVNETRGGLWFKCPACGGHYLNLRLSACEDFESMSPADRGRIVERTVGCRGLRRGLRIQQADELQNEESKLVLWQRSSQDSTRQQVHVGWRADKILIPSLQEPPQLFLTERASLRIYKTDEQSGTHRCRSRAQV